MRNADEMVKIQMERDRLASILADHCKAQDSGVYEAEGYYCQAFKCRCPFPFRDCSDITPEMWVDKVR